MRAPDVFSLFGSRKRAFTDSQPAFAECIFSAPGKRSMIARERKFHVGLINCKTI